MRGVDEGRGATYGGGVLGCHGRVRCGHSHGTKAWVSYGLGDSESAAILYVMNLAGGPSGKLHFTNGYVGCTAGLPTAPAHVW